MLQDSTILTFKTKNSRYRIEDLDKYEVQKSRLYWRPLWIAITMWGSVYIIIKDAASALEILVPYALTAIPPPLHCRWCGSYSRMKHVANTIYWVSNYASTHSSTQQQPCNLCIIDGPPSYLQQIAATASCVPKELCTFLKVQAN